MGKVVKLTENKITVLDFVISVLSQYEKEMNEQLNKLKKITERLEKKSIEVAHGKAGLQNLHSTRKKSVTERKENLR
ncbi:hypothetical protein CW711_03995 [Candidatus Bathyarchaeota archaeon]|nr:MAG: hypothetical protein B6U84_06135 [Candidatus Bathyarchaeota archaeon ex4484_40]RJS78931.1 MAG: hypothetical protein CW711_03995 [Candidatus Bathyarchaeota archaeon]